MRGHDDATRATTNYRHTRQTRKRSTATDTTDAATKRDVGHSTHSTHARTHARNQHTRTPYPFCRRGRPLHVPHHRRNTTMTFLPARLYVYFFSSTPYNNMHVCMCAFVCVGEADVRHHENRVLRYTEGMKCA